MKTTPGTHPRGFNLPALFCALSLLFILVALTPPAARGQVDLPVRMTTVKLNDGSEQVTKVDPATRTAEMSLFDPSKKLKQKVIYQLNDEGQWVSGVVYSAKGAIIMRATYQYDSIGRMAEEKQYAADGQFFRKLLYRYDPKGQPSGIDAYDANGNPVRSNPKPAQPVQSNAVATPFPLNPPKNSKRR